ncbi:TetR/AcrR family transcriptional regulator [Sulfidibacter corallicola]|uniref:TetR/AcrR family transcriptional regulator n=1 Tax=Sulfidibacter corallicola TaxID=2818388 RepID=A0A8A4TJP7_SULCO|nr:TetR/AcrR family transcriptional regulator [Sulfidibacter corallicola]QTD49372.1 TetR/AcrR family transcriptional regulator [Sulfidibacter corallicola]
MGRKSLAVERRTQILDAFQRCILKHGLEKSSLERIAAEAGVKHTIIRHYIGNRDQLLNALIDRFTEHYLAHFQEALSRATETAAVEALLQFLFLPAEEDQTREEEAIFSELLALAERDARVMDEVKRIYKAVEKSFREVLDRYFPEFSGPQNKMAAHAILCLSEANATRRWLGFPVSRSKDAYRVAKMILDGIAEQAKRH